MQVLVLFLLAFVATAQYTWYPVAAGDLIQKSSGAAGYFKYTATINEASVGQPARLSFTMSPALVDYVATLNTCYPSTGSPLVTANCVGGAECVLYLPPCFTNGNDAYVYQTDYYLSIDSLEALNFTVTDEAVPVTTMADSYTGSATIDGSLTDGPSSYAVFEYNRANLDDLSQFVLSANGFSYSASFTDDVSNICVSQLTPDPNGLSNQVKTYLESAVGGCPLPGSGTRYLTLNSFSGGSNTVNIWANQDTARASSNQIVDLTTGTRVALTWANNARPYAFAKLQVQTDRYVAVTLENPLPSASCRVSYHQDNAGPVPTPNIAKSCIISRVNVNSGNQRDLQFSACQAGTWYLTVYCNRAEVDGNGNGFYMTLGANETATQAYGTADNLDFAVTGAYTTVPQLIAFADNVTAGSTLPDGTQDKLIYVKFSDLRTSGGGQYSMRLARGSPSSATYTNCQSGNSLSFSQRTVSSRTIAPCAFNPNSGALYAYVDGPNTPNYEVTVTTRGPTNLGKDSTVNGVIDEQTTVHFQVDLSTSTTLTIFTPTIAQGSLDLGAYSPSVCGASPVYVVGQSSQVVAFCWDQAASSASWPTNSYLVATASNSGLDATYSVQSAAYELGSSIRTHWTDLSSSIDVSFDGQTSNNWVRTVEWDNQFQGFMVTMTAGSSTQLSLKLYVLDGCTEVYSTTTVFNTAGQVLSIGTATGLASGGMPGSFSSPTIRFFFEQQSNNNAPANITFTYTPQGNCLDSATVAAQATFCGTWLTTGTSYNFASSVAISQADTAAFTLYTSARLNFNTTEVSSDCLNDLKTWACETYFLPCQASGEVDKTPCSDICNTIANSCPSSSCFGSTCATISCSSGTQLVVGLSFLLVTILALVF